MKIGCTINLDNFQAIQDEIAEATGMAVITVDYKGIPITKHSKCSEFCKIIRQHPEYHQLCERCDSRGGLESVRMHQPYIYKCHAGIVDLATPIMINGQYLGAIMAGQVLTEENCKEKLEDIVYLKSSRMDLFIKKEVSEAYKLLPVMNLKKIESISKMLFYISKYIAKDFVWDMSLNKMNENPLTINGIKDLKIETRNLNNVYNIQESKFGVINGNENIDYHEDKHSEKTDVIQENEQVYKVSCLLKPALEYIWSNYNEGITINKMASLCNISPSYFSKLFKRDIKEGFSKYVNKIRIEKAKKLLQHSDIPIINISIDIGFEDCGYFIKVFKHMEGVTPALYRKRFNIKN